jgi:hypothetical protein
MPDARMVFGMVASRGLVGENNTNPKPISQMVLK